jgi:predicted GNAT family N-acyltransferase
VRQARTQDEVEAALRLRYAVFCEEQGVTLEAEQDGRDPQATHLVVIEHGRIIATCRLLIDPGVARLGRMVVSSERRGAGVGSALLSEADRVAVQAGALAIRLNAQIAARAVYDRAGYEAEGGVFVEEGIEHVTMEKRLRA